MKVIDFEKVIKRLKGSKLGYLGLRKLAIIRRDDPEFFRYLIS